MADMVAAKRYARALFDLTKEQEVLEKVETDLNDLAALIQSHKELHDFLKDPIITEDHQVAIIQSLFHDKVHMVTERFLLFLVEKERLDQIGLICQVFQRLCDDANGLANAHITTACELSDDQLQALKTRLEEISGKTVVTHLQVEPSLIGGFKVKIGDQVMDLTLQNQLQRLRENIINA